MDPSTFKTAIYVCSGLSILIGACQCLLGSGKGLAVFLGIVVWAVIAAAIAFATGYLLFILAFLGNYVAAKMD